MTTELDWIAGGGVTSPSGFLAGSAYTGVKTYGDDPRLDLGILAAEEPCAVAGLFTRNAVVGASIPRNRDIVASGGPVRAIVANSGNANTATGEQGKRDSERMALLTAEKLGVDAAEVIVCSTGVIGRLLPMDRVEPGITEIVVTREGGDRFSRAIMTTDTHQKQAAVRFTVAGRTYTVGGCAKGAGMIHPDMATMFAFLTTDAPVEQDWLRQTWRGVIGRSVNMIDVDMDTSTSDTALLLASGAAGGEPVGAGHPAAEALAAAIDAVATHLAREVVRGAEGARTLIEVIAEGAATVEDARIAARTIASSPLVKTMVTGRDPNWGRVMMAAGRSGARVDQDAASVWVGDHQVLAHGQVTEADLAAVSQAMDAPDVVLRIDLGVGSERATAWGCDLTEEYVRINADYTT